jgi:hypothetical protein
MLVIIWSFIEDTVVSVGSALALMIGNNVTAVDRSRDENQGPGIIDGEVDGAKAVGRGNDIQPMKTQCHLHHLSPQKLGRRAKTPGLGPHSGSLLLKYSNDGESHQIHIVAFLNLFIRLARDELSASSLIVVRWNLRYGLVRSIPHCHFISTALAEPC